jgi:1-acyl-sn-glycerol-3-phosphate acyltransferase
MRTFIGYLRVTAALLFTLMVAVIVTFIIPFDRHGHLYHTTSRIWSHVLLRLCGITITVRGAEKLTAGQNYIYVSNHASLLDIPCVAAGVPDQVRIVYKKELEKIPVFGWQLKWGSYVAIDRGNSAEARKSLDEAIGRIRHGASVLLFAEGTRTRDGRLKPFKRGAFNIAVSAGIPVVPLTINGTFGLLPKGTLALQAGPVELILEDPIDVGTEQGKEAELRLMEKVHSAIAKHYVDQ